MRRLKTSLCWSSTWRNSWRWQPEVPRGEVHQRIESAGNLRTLRRLRGGRRPPDLICQTRTPAAEEPAARGADATARWPADAIRVAALPYRDNLASGDYTRCLKISSIRVAHSRPVPQPREDTHFVSWIALMMGAAAGTFSANSFQTTGDGLDRAIARKVGVQRELRFSPMPAGSPPRQVLEAGGLIPFLRAKLGL